MERESILVEILSDSNSVPFPKSSLPSISNEAVLPANNRARNLGGKVRDRVKYRDWGEEEEEEVPFEPIRNRFWKETRTGIPVVTGARSTRLAYWEADIWPQGG